MSGIGTPWAFLFQHPIVGLVVFGVVSAGVILALSGGKLSDSLGGMMRVLATFFTTPFVFLRNALTIMRGSGEDDQDYAQSRVFMLFRFNRIQYLGLLVLALLMLSGGITTSVLTLYPQAEIEQGRALDEQIRRSQEVLDAAQRDASAAASPAHRQTLEQRRNEARDAHQQQQRANLQFMQNAGFSGPVISQIANARTVESIARTRGNIDYYMQGCPYGYNWGGISPDGCTQFRAFALELAGRREAELQARDAADEADRAWRNADQAVQLANARLQSAQATMDQLREQRRSVSLFNAMSARIWAALLGVLGTLLGVIIVVWLGAGLIEFFNWAILLMRASEMDAAARLAQARAERQAAEENPPSAY